MLFRRAALIILALISISATAKDKAKAKTKEVTPVVETCSPVEFAGTEIICLKKGIGAFTSEERALAIQRRLQSLSDKKTFDTEKITALNGETSSSIMAEETVLISLSDEDIDKKTDERKDFVFEVARRMRAAIKKDRMNKAPQELSWAMGYSLLATIVLLLILKVLGSVFPKIYSFIARNEGTYIRSVKFRSFEILNSRRIVAVALWMAKTLRFACTVLLLYIYIPLVLSFFPLTANWAAKLYRYIVDPFNRIVHVFIEFIPNIFFILVIVFVTRYALKFIHIFFTEIEDGRLEIDGFYKDWASPTYKLVRVLVIAFSFIMIFPYLPGSDSPAFQGVSVFIGLLLSLGSSSAVANVIAGLVLTYMRPFKVGDRVKIADTTGDILEKNLLVTRVRSIKNVDVTIPNSMVLGSHIINYSSTAASEGLILNTTITIGYDAPWRKVHELLKEAARRTTSISQEKQPFVLQTALNDFYVAYEINAYTNTPNKMALIYSELHQNIQDCFNEAGVEIMSPHYRAVRDGNEVTIPKG